MPHSTSKHIRIRLFRDERSPLDIVPVEDLSFIEAHDAEAEALPADALLRVLDRVAGKMECSDMRSVLRA